MTSVSDEKQSHTPGPWLMGVTLGQHLRHGETDCHHCRYGYRLLSVATQETSNPKDFTNVVHYHLIAGDECFRTITAADGTEIVGMYDYDTGGVCTNAADARLIAAAPDLLALAKQYAEECATCGGCGECDLPVDGSDDELESVPCIDCADIRAVIAKAEGRS